MAKNWTYAEVFAACCIEVGMRLLTGYYDSGPSAFLNYVRYNIDHMNRNNWKHDYETNGGLIWGVRGGP